MAESIIKSDLDHWLLLGPLIWEPLSITCQTPWLLCQAYIDYMIDDSFDVQGDQ